MATAKAMLLTIQRLSQKPHGWFVLYYPLLAGVLVFLSSYLQSSVYVSLQWVIFVALIPFVWAVDRLPCRWLVLHALLMGAAITTGGLHSFAIAASEKFQSVTNGYLAQIGLCLWMGIQCLVIVGLYKKLPLGKGAYRILWLPFVWVVVWRLFPMMMPIHFSVFITDTPWLIQGIRYTGTLGAEFFVVGVNVFLYLCWAHKKQWLLSRLGIMASSLILLWLAYGIIFIDYHDAHVARITHEVDPVTVGLIQPSAAIFNVNKNDSWYHHLFEAKASEALASEMPNPDLIIWTSGRDYRLRNPQVWQAFKAWIAKLGVPIAVTDAMFDENDTAMYRNAFMLVNGSGQEVGRYFKQELYPFVEYVPFHAGFNWLNIRPPGSDRNILAGGKQAPLLLNGMVKVCRY